jgi:two-component system LytT family response regulator
MKALIIEDELNCREVLLTLLERHAPAIKEYQLADSVDEGLAQIEAFQPDIVFLDIQLGDRICFDILDQLEEINFQIVFTTAYDHYAVKAFEYSAVHYLLKPIILTDLLEAVERCLNNQQNIAPETIDNVKSFYLRTSLKDYHITHDEIAYIKADGSYSTVHTNEGKNIFTSKKLADYSKSLTDDFYRIHHSIIVNLKWVSHLNKPGNFVVLTNGSELPISRRKKSDFKKIMLLR